MKINGRDLMVFLQEGAKWVAMGCSTACELEVTQEARPVVKLDGTRTKWQQFIPGKKGWTVDTEGLINIEGGDLMDLFGKEVMLRMDVAEAGQSTETYLREGMARCVEIKEDGKVGRMAQWRARFIGIGGLQYG